MVDAEVAIGRSMDLLAATRKTVRVRNPHGQYLTQVEWSLLAIYPTSPPPPHVLPNRSGALVVEVGICSRGEAGSCRGWSHSTGVGGSLDLVCVAWDVTKGSLQQCCWDRVRIVERS